VLSGNLKKCSFQSAIVDGLNICVSKSKGVPASWCTGPRKTWNTAFKVQPKLVIVSFLAHLFFGITQDVTNLQRLYHAVFHALRGPSPQDAGTPLLSSVFTSDSDSGPVKGLHRQSNLPWSLHRLLATAIFLSNYTVQLQCLQCAPWRRVTEKSNFSTLNIGLARTRNKTRATCMAGSVARRSAIHYAINWLMVQ
jgi:hypothetical protein